MTTLHLMPTDQETATRVVAALRGARLRCISPVAALHQAGLLMTEHNARLLRHDILTITAQTIRDTRMKDLAAAGLMPRDATPAQVAKAIADRVDWLAEQAKRGEYR